MENRWLGFNKMDNARRGREVYILSGAGVTLAEAQYKYTVVPFFSSSSVNYWLGVSLEFEFVEGERHLSNVCLQIFEGLATDDKKTPLVRAEWDNNQGPGQVLHAQPHWHIYPSRVNREREKQQFVIEPGIQTFTPGVKEGDFNGISNSEWNKAEKFHFAMASRWHIDGKNAHQEKIDTGKLPKWLDGCVSYIRDQLQYLHR